MARARSRSIRIATAGAVSLAMLATSAGAAGAVSEPDSTEEVAGLIAAVAPDQGDVVNGAQGAAGVTAQVGQVAVTVPSDADAPVVLDTAGDLPALEVTLPVEVDADAAEIADDGTVVYEGEDATAATQILADGSVRLQTVTHDADGPHEFTYTFGDHVIPVQKQDGSGIELIADYGSVAITVGEVAPAWAVDANGNDVSTAYIIEGDALVQVIEPTADSAYPVVADPRLSRSWWNTTVHFNRAETASLAGGAGAAAAVAAFIPDPTVSKIIAAAAGIAAAYISTVHANGGCIKAVLYGHIPPAVWQPYGGSEAGGFCR